MGLNLKSKIFFDNKEVVKGTKESKEAVREFGKASEGFMDKFAGLFGVSMGQISGSVKAFQGSVISLSGAQKTAATSSGVLSGALKILKLALAATGIGALIVALGSLVAYFKSSQDGADKLSRMMEPLELAFKLVTDAAAAIGRALVNAFENPKQAISDLWEFLKNQFVNRLLGLGNIYKSLGNLLVAAFKLDKAGIKASFQELGDAAKQTLTGLDEEQRKNAAENLKRTKEDVKARMALAKQLNDREKELERQRIAFIERRANLEREIARQRAVAADEENYTAEQRLEAQKKAMATTRQMYAEEKRLEAEATAIMEGRLSLSENMREDERALADQKAKLIGLETQQDDALRTLLRRYNTLIGQAQKEKEERELLLKIEQRRANLLPQMRKIELPALKVPLEFPTAAEIRGQIGELLTFGYEVQEGFLDFSNIVAAGISSLSEALGELFASGDMATFSDALLSTFGGLVKQLGQMVLQLGLGLLAAQMALKSVNPYLAIAAGAALIALGSAFAKSTQKLGQSISGGATGYGGSINTVSTRADVPATEKLQVVVSGELRARGNTLVGVIANEDNRRRLAT